MHIYFQWEWFEPPNPPLATPLLSSSQPFSQSVHGMHAQRCRRTSRCQHVTPLLRELHWLQSRERVDFKLAVLIFRCLHGLAPLLNRRHTPFRQCLRSSSSALLIVRPTRLVTMGYRAYCLHDFVTVYRTTSPLLPRSLFSAAV